MTESLKDTWTWREYPLLREAGRQLDGGHTEAVYVSQLAQDLNIDPQQAQIGIEALYQGGFLSGAMVAEVSGPVVVTGITSKAREKLGLWPSPEAGLERLVAAIDALIARSGDEDERTRWEKLRNHVTANGAQVGWSLVTAVLTGQLPGQ